MWFYFGLKLFDKIFVLYEEKVCRKAGKQWQENLNPWTAIMLLHMYLMRLQNVQLFSQSHHPLQWLNLQTSELLREEKTFSDILFTW